VAIRAIVSDDECTLFLQAKTVECHDARHHASSVCTQFVLLQREFFLW
jgi:hypothetical protein